MDVIRHENVAGQFEAMFLLYFLDNLGENCANSVVVEDIPSLVRYTGNIMKCIGFI